MNENHTQLLGKEHPYSHHLQLIAALAFFPIWFFDSFIFKFSIRLARFVPWVVRLILAFLVIIIAVLMMRAAEKVLFHETDKIPTVIEIGILAYVRHPLYLGMLLAYFGFILGTFSIISVVIFIFIVLIYNKMATYEEQDLERIFSEKYVKYKRRVPKWIPRLSEVMKRFDEKLTIGE